MEGGGGESNCTHLCQHTYSSHTQDKRMAVGTPGHAQRCECFSHTTPVYSVNFYGGGNPSCSASLRSCYTNKILIMHCPLDWDKVTERAACEKHSNLCTRGGAHHTLAPITAAECEKHSHFCTKCLVDFLTLLSYFCLVKT